MGLRREMGLLYDEAFSQGVLLLLQRGVRIALFSTVPLSRGILERVLQGGPFLSSLRHRLPEAV
jgi:hypothetical protein